jgi:hypothetical protein
MGCSVEQICPKPLIVKMEKKLLDWHIEDPKGKPIDDVRKIRNEIESKVLDRLKSIPAIAAISNMADECEFISIAKYGGIRKGLHG